MCYERALRVRTSFPISGLARLGVKPRLCRSSWKVLASTHPLILPSTCSREALLACPPCPPRNLLSFTVESTFSTPCSRFDLPLSPRFGSFVFGRPVCSSFSAEACAILHASCWSRQHQQVCHFSFFSYYLTLVLSSPPCPLLHLSFYLKLCGRSGRNCLVSRPVLSDYNGSPDTCFFRGTTRLMNWPDGERYLRPPQSLEVSLLLPLVSTLVLSRTGGVLSRLNSLTHMLPRFPLRNLCSLVTLAVSSLVFASTDTAFF